MLPAQAKREMWPCNAAARAEDEEDEARMACTLVGLCIPLRWHHHYNKLRDLINT